jgi:hypothetical protein
MVRNKFSLLAQQAANAKTYTLIEPSALGRTCLSAEIRCRRHATALQFACTGEAGAFLDLAEDFGLHEVRWLS